MYNIVDNKAKKQTLTWITPDYFVDCDFNPEILIRILAYFDIHWIILLPSKKARFSESEFKQIKDLMGITIEFIYWTCRARSPKRLLFYEKIRQRIKLINSDLLYLNYVPTNPYVLPFYLSLNNKKTIVTAHDGNVKSSFKFPLLAKFVHYLAYSSVKNINMFSITEASLLKKDFKNANVYLIPLALKDFGEATSLKRSDFVTFFFFGSINSNKNLELLIKAACNLWEQGTRNFRVSINGYCDNWLYYQKQIKFPELFECDIRQIENDEIPMLFGKNHYMVFPYKDLSQSGAIKVAFNYNIPVIVSDLKGFTDEVTDNINGFVFESNNVKDLERVVFERIEKYKSEYPILQSNIRQFNLDNYSPSIISGKYVAMFNDVINTKFNK